VTIPFCITTIIIFVIFSSYSYLIFTIKKVLSGYFVIFFNSMIHYIKGSIILKDEKTLIVNEHYGIEAEYR
jgi:hypothetical protein